MASEKALKTGLAKLETVSFLQREGLPFPLTSRISEIESVDRFPVIVKPLAGSGSRGVHVAGDQETFDYLKEKCPESIVQEYLDREQGEFTCGLFRSNRGIIRTIIFKRELMGGLSIYGEVVDNEDIENLLIRIAIGLELRGSINVQLRLTEKGPVVFEINPRFSSTVLFRHLLGFKDVEWAIEDCLNLPLSGYARVSQGKRFYKGFAEYIE
jgi:carbamoyl-phosphate synthase large subunit